MNKPTQAVIFCGGFGTRFNDGNELGLGAEIGISTTKLHAFGPRGLNELTTQNFVILGEGQIK